MYGVPTLWPAYRHVWASAIAVAGAERCKAHVPEGGRFVCVGPSELVDLLAIDTKFGTLVSVKSVSMIIPMLCEELTLGAHYTCRARSCNLYLFSFFHARVQTTDCSWNKLGGTTVTVHLDVPLCSPIPGHAKCTCKAGLFNLCVILRV